MESLLAFALTSQATRAFVGQQVFRDTANLSLIGLITHILSMDNTQLGALTAPITAALNTPFALLNAPAAAAENFLLPNR